MALFGKDISEEEVLGKYNVFEGIECTAVLPEKQLKTSGKSGATKGLATFAFGFVGLAATSGTSQNEENREIKTIFQVVNKGIVFKNGCIQGNDLRIPYEEIVKMEVITPKNKYQSNFGLITLLENKRIILNSDIDEKESANIVMNHINDIINQRANGIKFEEPGWGLDSHKTADNNKDIKHELNYLICLKNMYEEGLLTDEEFTAMKKKLIEE